MLAAMASTINTLLRDRSRSPRAASLACSLSSRPRLVRRPRSDHFAKRQHDGSTRSHSRRNAALKLNLLSKER